MSPYWYRKSHCGDQTILQPSYLHNGISYAGKMTSLYWIRALLILHYLQESCCEYMVKLNTYSNYIVGFWNHCGDNCMTINPLRRLDDHRIVLSPQWGFLYWLDGILILNWVTGPWNHVTLSMLMDCSWSIHICNNYGSQHGPEYFSFGKYGSQRRTRGLFHELSKMFFQNLCIAEIILLVRNFQLELKFMHPKLCFRHTYRISAWNSHHKCDFWLCIFSRDYFGELPKCLLNNPQNHWEVESHGRKYV